MYKSVGFRYAYYRAYVLTIYSPVLRPPPF